MISKMMRQMFGPLCIAAVGGCGGQTVPVQFYELDAAASCFRQVTDDLDAEYWTDWVEAEVCNDTEAFVARADGQCVVFTSVCPEVPPDPSFVSCDEFPDCCAENMDETDFCP